MGAFGLSKNRVDMLCNRASLLGNGITGACFQAPHAAPGQKPMETKLVVPPFVFITCQQSFAGGL